MLARANKKGNIPLLTLQSIGETGLKRSKTISILSLILLILTILVVQKTFFPEKTIQNVSAISTSGIGVYWNQNCTNSVTSISWGTLLPGENKSVTLYVKNQDNVTITLVINTTNWNPEKAREFLVFSWTPTSAAIEPQKAAKITIKLQVRQNITGIGEFRFDIAFEGKTFLPTDVNKDGKVDMIDLYIVTSAFGSRPGSANWNEIADIDKNGYVDMKDIYAVARDFGKTA